MGAVVRDDGQVLSCDRYTWSAIPDENVYRYMTNDIFEATIDDSRQIQKLEWQLNTADKNLDREENDTRSR